MNNEAAYWIALAHLPRWGYLKINKLILQFFHDKDLTIEEFFQLSETDWKNQFGLNMKEIEDLRLAKNELASNAFLAETLDNEGYDLIPIISPEYSKTLKENLKMAHAPALLYVKGNKQILQKKSVAIVGSREASAESLHFTDRVARLVSQECKVVVSGFAKGVDKQALDSAILYKGQSIIVLPQGILTFGTGYKTYYKHIVEGDVLVLSVFHPKSPWRAELAMARNPIIYGLANEIYVAESSDKGGTWSGVIDGLRKKRMIYVRTPETSEDTANYILIQKGAIPLDINGLMLSPSRMDDLEKKYLVDNELDIYNQNKILDLLRAGEFTTKEVLKKLQLDWTIKKLRDFMGNHPEIETIQHKPLRFTVKKNQNTQLSLFEI